MRIHEDVQNSSVLRPSPEEIVLRLRGEFLVEARERLDRLNEILDDFYADRLPGDEATRLIRQEAHNLKGMGTTFGFAVISEIMHLLEDVLEQMTLASVSDIQVVEHFIDPVESIIDIGESPPEEDCARIFRNLPHTPNARPATRSQRRVDLALVIVHSRTIGKKIAGELEKIGFAVEIAGNSVDMLPLIVRRNPSLVITSYSLEGMNGVDLVKAVTSMSQTRHTPIALLTSYDLAAPELDGMPEQVPIVQLGAGVDEELIKALTALEFRWPVFAGPTSKD